MTQDEKVYVARAELRRRAGERMCADCVFWWGETRRFHPRVWYPLELGNCVWPDRERSLLSATVACELWLAD